MRSSGRQSDLRRAALTALAAGAAGSAGLTIYAGRHNSAYLLIALFVLWVLSPFAALLVAGGWSKRWFEAGRKTLYGLMLVVTLACLAIYGEVALGPPRAHTAFMFLVVPLVSWLAIAVVVVVGRRGKPQA